MGNLEGDVQFEYGRSTVFRSYSLYILTSSVHTEGDEEIRGMRKYVCVNSDRWIDGERKK